MSKTNIVCLMIGIIVFITLMVVSYEARNEIASQEVTMQISRTIEKISENENRSVSSSDYLIGNYSVGAKNETDFMKKIRENNIETIYYTFEEGDNGLTKKYWGMLANSNIELKQKYMPIKKNLFFGEPSGMMVFNIKNYNDENVSFEKSNVVLYYIKYTFMAAFMGVMAGVLAFCLSFLIPFLRS